jgi:hypothetical protein
MSRIAESYILGYRPGRSNDPAIEKAVKSTEREPELHRRLESQVRFDEQVARAIHAIAPPPGLRQKVGAGGNGRPGVKGSPFGLTLLIAVICGLSVIIGLLIFYGIDQHQKFNGSEAVARIIGTAKSMNGLELERVSNKAGQLGDWFYLRGFDAYHLPPEFADAPAVGSRVFKQDGHAVAQVAIDWHDSVLYTFRADDFGIDLPEEKDWRFIPDDHWIAALRRDGPLCTIVAFRGDKSDMRTFLHSLEKK